MIKETITKGNKLIAEFMDLKESNGRWYRWGKYAGQGYFEELKYYSYWNWLMPVLEKIMQNKYEDGDTAYPRTFGMLNVETGKPMVRLNRHQVFEADTLIEATWLSIVDFIEWHNRKEFMNKNKLGEQDMINDNKPSNI